MIINCNLALQQCLQSLRYILSTMIAKHDSCKLSHIFINSTELIVVFSDLNH